MIKCPCCSQPWHDVERIRLLDSVLLSPRGAVALTETEDQILSMEQIAAAWNRAMQVLGYIHEQDRTAQEWDEEYAETPAAIWAKEYPKAKDRPRGFPWYAAKKKAAGHGNPQAHS